MIVSVGNVDRGTSGISESSAVNSSSLQSAKSQLVFDYNTGAPVVVQFPLTNLPRYRLINLLAKNILKIFVLQIYYGTPNNACSTAV